MTFQDEIKHWGSKAAWTAIEAGLAVLIASNALALNVSTLETAGIAALSAALTVLSRFVRTKTTEE